ncbi:TetR/AcrR family transcriptional regulator [Azospirillum sp. 412522]|nr:TetR/AcrR family transcriptional regulator [Azospirillum sp. 412522]MBY6263525.1 TetR/AcrR family transcriptional regulator [Azospirillum sp. 412522]
MGITERKGRERAEREVRIVAVARAVAEREGWAAVTVRRLADEIEYSQPVLYSHFKNRDAIVAAVAVEGFRELTAVLVTAAGNSANARAALENAASAYLHFAFGHPALYEAMFVLPSGLRFAEEDTGPELREAFGALASVVAPFHDDNAVATETFWAALHGLAELERTKRIRPVARLERVRLLVRSFTGDQDSI